MKNMNTLRFALPMAVSLSFGAVACSDGAEAPLPSTQGTTFAETGCQPGFFTDVRIIAPAKEGGMNAVNAGNCAAVYNSKTLATVGSINHQDGFVIDCKRADKPAGFVVETVLGIQGEVNVSQSLSVQILTETFAVISNCDAADIVQ